MWSGPRRAAVATTGPQCLGMERVHRRAAWCGEGEMEAGARSKDPLGMCEQSQLIPAAFLTETDAAGLDQTRT